MILRKQPVQLLILVAVAVVCALVSNAFASRQRRLVLPGDYPNALRVPPRAVAAPVAIPTPIPAPAPAPPPAAEAAAAPQKPAPQKRQPLTVHRRPSEFKPHPDKPYVEISGDDVAFLYEKGALFLDARRSSVYEEGHIAGARSFPVWESDIDDRVMALFDERSDPAEQNQPIVIYCSGGACEDSHMLAQKLWGLQFNNVYVYKDGFPDWQNRKGRTQRGANP